MREASADLREASADLREPQPAHPGRVLDTVWTDR